MEKNEIIKKCHIRKSSIEYLARDNIQYDNDN